MICPVEEHPLVAAFLKRFALVPTSQLAGDAKAESNDSDEGKSDVKQVYVIILFTDGGYENPDTQQTFDDAAKNRKTASDHNIKIYTVGVGTGQEPDSIDRRQRATNWLYEN